MDEVFLNRAIGLWPTRRRIAKKIAIMKKYKDFFTCDGRVNFCDAHPRDSDSQYQILLVLPLRAGMEGWKGGLGIPTITNYQGMIALRSLVGLIVEDDPLNFLYGLPNGLQ